LEAKGLEVIATGKLTTYDDPNRPVGPVRYVAWTYDDLGNYSAPVSVGTEIALGSLGINPASLFVGRGVN